MRSTGASSGGSLASDEQLAALRGATYGLMADVLESHMRETFGSATAQPTDAPAQDAEVDHMVRMLRSFLR